MIKIKSTGKEKTKVDEEEVKKGSEEDFHDIEEKGVIPSDVEVEQECLSDEADSI